MLAIFAVLHLVLLGCTTETTTPTETEEQRTISDPESDYSIVSSSFAGYMEGAGQWIDEIAEIPVVQNQLAGLDGFTYDSLSSLRIEGQVVFAGDADTVNVEIVVMAMRNIVDSLSSAAYLSFINFPGSHWVLEPSILSFIEPATGSGFERIDPETDLWLKSMAPTFSSADVKHPLAAAQWKKWADCTWKKALGRCAGVVVVCRWMGPNYFHCVAVGCAGAIISAAVECALTYLF